MSVQHVIFGNITIMQPDPTTRVLQIQVESGDVYMVPMSIDVAAKVGRDLSGQGIVVPTGPVDIPKHPLEK